MPALTAPLATTARTGSPAGWLAVLAAAAAMVAAMTLEATVARANDLFVKYDQSQLLRLPRPVAEIIIGNPSIADVSVQAGTLLVITGKSFGITNIIALDAERNVIQDQRVIVQRDVVKIVNLQKGTKRESYNCSPQCNPTVTVGDDATYFEQMAKNAERKMKMSDGTSDGNPGGGQ
ncbi:MAG: pilus assembly protein N-terminal domain-containing protein [Hyphomicrobiaceae bacterium]